MIRAKASPRARSWGYFVPAIHESRAKRDAAQNGALANGAALGPPARAEQPSPLFAAFATVAEKYR